MAEQRFGQDWCGAFDGSVGNGNTGGLENQPVKCEMRGPRHDAARKHSLKLRSGLQPMHKAVTLLRHPKISFVMAQEGL